ncbi:MAG: zf-HC2 domain-containing protein [Gammaproteobacteria bacterium]|nr:zf-HC2 domain-containing protein [Gammaproteobacteria bacterium]
MLKCQEVTRLYSEAQERRLTLSERAGLKLHVMMCEGCRNFGRQMLDLRRFARGYARGESESKPVSDHPADEPSRDQE